MSALGAIGVPDDGVLEKFVCNTPLPAQYQYTSDYPAAYLVEAISVSFFFCCISSLGVMC